MSSGPPPLSFKDRLRQRSGGGYASPTPQPVLSPVPEEIPQQPPQGVRRVTSPLDASFSSHAPQSAAGGGQKKQQPSPLISSLQPPQQREPRQQLSPSIVTLTLGGSGGGGGAPLFSLEGAASSKRRDSVVGASSSGSPGALEKASSNSGAFDRPSTLSPTVAPTTTTRGRSGSKTSSNASPSDMPSASATGETQADAAPPAGGTTPLRSPGNSSSTMVEASGQLSRSGLLNRSRSREKILPRRNMPATNLSGSDLQAPALDESGGGGAFSQYHLRSPQSPSASSNLEEQLFVAGSGGIVRRKSTSNFSSLKYSASGRRISKDLARLQQQQLAESASDVDESPVVARSSVKVQVSSVGDGGGGGGLGLTAGSGGLRATSAAGMFAKDAIVEALVQLQETPEYVFRTEYNISAKPTKLGGDVPPLPSSSSPLSPSRSASAADLALAEAAALYGAYSPTAEGAPKSKFESSPASSSSSPMASSSRQPKRGDSSSSPQQEQELMTSPVVVTLTVLDQTAISRDAEVGRYLAHHRQDGDALGVVGSISSATAAALHAGGGVDADGGCMCTQSSIQKDIRGFDYSQYHTHKLFYECHVCHRQPSSFLCIQCLKSFCPSHVHDHFLASNNMSVEASEALAKRCADDPMVPLGTVSPPLPHCALFINLHDISTSFDRVFWCEACRRFTWKFTEVYEPLTEQICFTKGTYWGTAIRDVHAIGYSMILPPPSLAEDGVHVAGNKIVPLRLDALSATTQGWRSTQEDAECMFLASFTMRDAMNFLNSLQPPPASSPSPLSKKKRSLWLASHQQTLLAVKKLSSAQGEEDIPVAFVGVCDGHGGDQVAKLAAASLERMVKKHLAQACSYTQGTSSSSSVLLPGIDDDDDDDDGDNQQGRVSGGRRSGPLELQFEECLDPDGSALRQRDEVLIGDDDDDDDDDVSTKKSQSIASPGERRLVLKLVESLFRRVIQESLLALDSEIRDSPEGRRGDYNCVGCTCCLVGVSNHFVLCGNCGDSGAAIFTTSSLTMLSTPHRLSDEKERLRVRAAGYSISEDDRIEGLLAVPRALGDYDFKQCGGKSQKDQAVSALADVVLFEPPTGLELLLPPSDGNGGEVDGATPSWGVVVACDGVWDTATRKQVQHALSSSLVESTEPQGSNKTGGVGDSVILAEALLRRPLRGDNHEPFLLGGGGGGGGSRREINMSLLQGCGRVFLQCVAPTCNDEGIGLDNVSCIVVKCTPIQGECTS